MSKDKLVLQIEVDQDNASYTVKDFRKKLKGVGTEAGKNKKSFQSMWKGLVGAGAAIALLHKVEQAMQAMITAAADFETQWGNVTTLVDTSKVDMGGLQSKVLGLAGNLGSATDLTKGLYQALSAGVKPAESVKFIGESAKFSKAGLASLEGSVDVLTTVLNAYGMKSSEVTKVADMMFETVKRGKTTVAELSQYFGQVIGTAATVGIKFDELNASIASMTAGGIKTSQTMTSLKAIIANIAKPSADAAKLAGKLGINFSVAGLKAQGLTGFLVELVKKTKGNTQAQIDLFGSVEAFNAIAVLTSSQGMQRYKDALKGMETSSGNTEIAFKKMTSTWNATWEGLKNKFEASITKKLLPAFHSLVVEIERLEKSGELGNIINDLSSAIGGMTKAIFNGVGFLIKNKETIKNIAITIATMWAVQKITAWAMALPGILTMLGSIQIAIINVTASIGAATTAITGTAAAISVATLGVGALIALLLKLKSMNAEREEMDQRRIRTLNSIAKTDVKFEKLLDRARKVGLGDQVAKYAKQLREVNNLTGTIAKIRIWGLIKKETIAREEATKNTELYAKATQKVKDYCDKHNVSVKVAIQRLADIKKASKEASDKNRAFALSLGLIPDMHKLSDETGKVVGAFRQYSEAIFSSDEKTAIYAKKVAELTAQYSRHGKEVPKALRAIQTEINNSAWGWKELEKSIPKPRKFDFLNMVPPMAEPATESVYSLDSVMKDLNSDLEESLKEMTSSSESAQELNASLELLDKSLNLLSGAFSSLGIDASGVIGVFGNLSKGVQTFSTASAFDVECMFESFGDGLGGFLENFSAGLSSISAYAAGATAVIGGLVKGIKALFGGHNWSKWVDNVNRTKIPLGEFKDDIKKLAKELRKSAMSTQDAATQAYNTYLAQVIREADVKRGNFEQYAESVFNMLHQLDDAINYKSSASIDETINQLGDAFGALAEKQKLTNSYSIQMKNILSEAKDRGLEIAEIEAYRLEKNKSGFESYKKLYDTTALTEMIEKQKELKKSMEGMREGSEAYHQARKEVLELGLKIAEDTKYQKIFGSTSLEIYEQMAKEEKQLSSQKCLVDKIKEFTNMMINFSDVNNVTAQHFAGFQKTAAMSFQELTKGGMDSDIALKQLAPSLTRLIELSNAHGFVIDENTQAMIDQAKEAGISLEKQIDPQERMVDILEKIAIKFGCDIPNAMDEMANSAEASFQRTRGGLTLLEGGAQQLGKTFRSSLNGLQTKVKNLATDLGITVGSSNNGSKDILNLPDKIPGFATGTGGWITQPSLFVAGEDGPELLQTRGNHINITPANQIISNQKSETVIRKEYFIHLEGSASKVDKEDLALVVREIINDGTRGVAKAIKVKVS